MIRSTSPRALFILGVFCVATAGYTFESRTYADVELEVFRSIARWLPKIESSAVDFDVDPKLIVAVLYVEKTQYVLRDWQAFRDYVENVVAEYFAFVKDLLYWADLSSGYCRIKPSFALETYERLKIADDASPRLDRNDVDPFVYGSSPAISIRIMAAGFHAIQKEWADAGFDISNRPEIIATLYNLGYNRALPKADPRSGRSVLPVVVEGEVHEGLSFGDRVSLVMRDSDLLQRLFEVPH